MKVCADTSFLCALYRLQIHSRAAADYLGSMQKPLEISSLLVFEFQQSIRLQVWLLKNNDRLGISRNEAATILSDFKSDLYSGVFTLEPVPWQRVHATADRLSGSHTEIKGYRAMDILHVATALEQGATEFLTFDKSQKRLAESEGLTVPV